MIDDKRYILIKRAEVTQEMIDNCIQTSFDSLRPVNFAGDPNDWTVLKWKGTKPAELWNEFPVYSDMEMRDILLNDLNRIE